MTVAAPARASAPAPARSEREPVPWTDLFLLAGTAAIALVPCARFWNANPDYSFGWGVPFLAAYLFAERWPGRPAPTPRGKAFSRAALISILTAWALALSLVRLLAETEPGWRPGLWLGMSLLVGALLAWCGLRGGRAWVRHFAFPIAFLFLAVPWIFNLELPVVQGLMRGNAALVADSLLLADVPARALGNTLQLATGTLGVEAACSGIRSLQAALMMSVFLGEFYRFRWTRRLLLPGLAVLFALAGNYLRLLFLAWRGAHGGVAAVDALHDSAGFTILAFTILGLWLICLALRGRRAGKPAREISTFIERPAMSLPRRSAALFWAAGLLLAALAAEGFTQGWYAWRESSAPRFPAWTIAWPADAAGFRSIAIPPASRDLLRYDAAKTGSWRDPRGWRWNALWLRYRPETGNKIVFDSHNPEICLPGAGWRERAAEGIFPVAVRGVALEVRGYLFATDHGDEHVFWIAYRNRGNIAPFAQRQGVYGRTASAFLQRSLAWGRDAWEGCRGVDAETLELALAGPPDATTARRACVEFLRREIVPEDGTAAVSVIISSTPK